MNHTFVFVRDNKSDINLYHRIEDYLHQNGNHYILDTYVSKEGRYSVNMLWVYEVNRLFPPKYKTFKFK